MISIIIPAYNNDALNNAINSILKQKISNLEIIIIDDSEDKKIKQTIQNINHLKPLHLYFFDDILLLNLITGLISFGASVSFLSLHFLS